MWLWILSGIFLALIWAVWFILRPTGDGPAVDGLFPTWVAILITAVVVLGLVTLVLWRRIRAARAARALEKAIAQQAQEQALNSKPERAAEIQELHRQIQQGISALKASKLGGNKRGADALYALPWYVLVGPPGAGKTTALRHSGLVFPYLDPTGGGVRGVGGTRNCDWWFTNEAILLDTAGRYTTEADDHDEWIAFLQELLKYREEKPLNGVMVAISINELLDATDDQIEQTASKIRARIDEMQNTLKMVLPVYVTFTKVDLIAGFSEFFGDLKKSDRSQAWGATLRLDQDKAEPGKIFDGEFDILVEHLHTRGLRRMALERSRETKEKVYQFPLEFAAIKRNLSDFLAAAFKPSGNVNQPILRGFYFSSGTQEGKPLDRVVGAMGRAFGLRPAAAEEAPEPVESKSYFLRDIFTGVMFPDADLAVRTEAEVRRKFLRQVGAAAIAGAIALLFLVPAVLSFVKNRALVADTRKVTTEAAEVKWTDPGSPVDKVDRLDHLREHAELLDQYKNEGAPLAYRWFMYQGDRLLEPTLDEYVAILRAGFVLPVKDSLEDKLRHTTGAKYLEEYNNLKTYLLLDDKVHLNEVGGDNTALSEWEVGRLTHLWAENLRRTNSDISEADLQSKLRPHVSFYVDLLKRGVRPGEPVDKALIERTRDILTRVGPAQRFYDQFVTTLIDQKYDEAGPNTRENLKYPPVSLNDLFYDRPEVLTKVKSSLRERQGKWNEVQGPYTYKGHQQVTSTLDNGTKALDREKWVVPLTIEEKREGAKIQQALDRVRQDYDNEYIRQWTNFFRDIDVDIPVNNREAINEFKVLSTPDWPYLRLLRTLSDNTQFDDVDEKNEAEAALLVEGGVVDQIKTKIQRRIESKTRVRLNGIVNNGPGERYDPIPDKFKSMVRFGVNAPPKSKETNPDKAPEPTNLSTYVGKLEQLSGEMGNIEDGPPNADTKKATEKFEEAVKTTEGLILKMDDTGQELMTPLLMNPLKQGYKALIRHAGGAASGLWEVVVWPPYRDKIKDRYPFNLAATRDASFSDAVAFFKPKGGILWGFYDKYLAQFHTKLNHDFIPDAHLEARPRPARPFTPFNPNMYNCLKRADEITDALFGMGGGEESLNPGAPVAAAGSGGEGEGKPKVDFVINLKTVSPIVSEVIFEVDGQKRLYRNEKEFWYQYTWPGPKPGTGARIQVRGAGGLDEEIRRDGPWGLFRLFEAATSTAEKDNDKVFTVTWDMTAPPVTVTMEVRPTRANNPFPGSFFRATNCPPSIGDKFGKGKG